MKVKNKYIFYALNVMMKSLKKIISVCILFPAVNALAQSNENWTEVNLSVTDSQVMPAYVKFSQAAAVLNEMAGEFCASASNDSLSVLQHSYHETMDAWQGIQHIQFGPITYFNWKFRLQYWPDDKGTGGRQLSALIAAQNEAELENDNFARLSVGVQGFPALERLLFSQTSLNDMKGDTYRCQTVLAIAENISVIAKGVSQRWTDEFRDTVANANERGFFENSEDATIDFLKALVESVPRIYEQKLLPALGDSQATARERRAESWRSQRSLRNIKVNVAALSEYFNAASDAETVTLSSVFLTEDVNVIKEIFTQLDDKLTALPDSIVVALDNETDYAALQSLEKELKNLDEALELALKNTDLYLGFNSLDGD